MTDLGRRIVHAADETAGRTVTPPFATVARRARAARTRRTVMAATAAVLVAGGAAAAIPRLGGSGTGPTTAAPVTGRPTIDVCTLRPADAQPLAPCARTIRETPPPPVPTAQAKVCPGRLENGAGLVLEGSYEGHDWTLQAYRIGEEACQRLLVDGHVAGVAVANGPDPGGTNVKAGRIDAGGGRTASLLWGSMPDTVAEVACTVRGGTVRATTGTTWMAPRTLLYAVTVDADPSSPEATCVGYGYDGTEISRQSSPPPSDDHG